MQLPQASGLLVPLLLAASPASAMLDCKKIVIEGQKFDLSKLGGPHSVVTSRFEDLAQTHFNTTYTVDVCQPLKKSGKSEKSEECPNGTRGTFEEYGDEQNWMITSAVCAIERTIKDDTDMVSKVVAIAGNLENTGGSSFEYEATRLKTSDSHDDSKKEGLRLVLKGGKHPLNGPRKERREQQAVIEFLCDKEKTGLEGEWESEDRYDGDDKKLRKRDGEEEDEDDGVESGVEHQLIKDDAALIWESYGSEGNDKDILRLTWHTKYACENRDDSGDDEGDSDSSSHWGFFTWFILM